MKQCELKFKKVLYKKKNLYVFNNIDKEKLDEHSDFLIASITKVFTIISLLILHQEKQININDTFKKYLDHKELENIKIIDVMNHISGMKNMPEKYNNSIENYNNIKKEKLIKHKKNTYNYSNLGYMLLGVLIETITSTMYKEYIYERILKPLKMIDSGFSKTNITHYTFNMKKLTNKQHNERFNSISDCGLKSSISDLIKFKRFYKLLNKKTLVLLKKINIFSYNNVDKTYIISFYGNMEGIKSKLIIQYDTKWNYKDIEIEFITNF